MDSFNRMNKKTQAAGRTPSRPTLDEKEKELNMRIFVGALYRAVVLAFVVIVMVALGYSTKAYAAPGDLDPSFGTDGKLTTDFGANTDYGQAVAVQDDGKIVVAGYASIFTATGTDFAIARYNPNGTLDSTFGTGGKVLTPIGA